jgi:hypothetical protein
MHRRHSDRPAGSRRLTGWTVGAGRGQKERVFPEARHLLVYWYAEIRQSADDTRRDWVAASTLTVTSDEQDY